MALPLYFPSEVALELFFLSVVASQLGTKNYLEEPCLRQRLEPEKLILSVSKLSRPLLPYFLFSVAPESGNVGAYSLPERI